jgi:hypothetical protein
MTPVRTLGAGDRGRIPEGYDSRHLAPSVPGPSAMKNLSSGNFTFALAVFLLASIDGYPQKSAADSNVAIEIVVKADKGLDGIIRGYLTRSLGELKGVTIDDVEPDYQIECVAVEQSLEGYGPCCVLSFVVLDNGDSLMLAVSYALSHKESIPEALYTILPNQYKESQHSVTMVPRDSLQRACSEFIVSFEGEELEPNRKMIERCQ